MLQAEHCEALDLEDAITMEAWIKPAKFDQGGARIVDKYDYAYMLDTYPGNLLRMIVGNVPTMYNARLRPGRWTHIAGVFSIKDRIRKLYVDGKGVASTGRASML